MNSGLLAALIGAAALLTGTLLPLVVRWASGRRAASGKITTSDAATLWAASEKMRAETAAQLDKAVEQRDRLIESQAGQVLPALATITTALATIATRLDANAASLTRLEARGAAGAGGEGQDH